ncbi:MAG: peptide deformylase [Candidatus Omnitrophota bacterium]
MDNQKNVLEIKRYPDPILRRKSAKVHEIDLNVVKLLEDMLRTMYAFGGIGLAASQVGSLVQIIVADTGEGAIKLINPCIINGKEENKLAEGCLSLPDINVEIKRPYEIIVEGLNEKNELIEIKASGLLARVIQHEMDHLRGRLIIDYLGLIDKMKLFKLKKRKQRE